MSGSTAKWNWRIPRSPDFYIGGKDDPYMRRWWVIPRNRFFNVYLHNMLRDDDDRALHDHPWWNLSIVLKGGYLEWLSHKGEPNDVRWCGPGSVILRRPTLAHRLTLGWAKSGGLRQSPSWSLFITGPVVRDWGFHCPKGWRVWRDFVSKEDTGAVGPGCD